MELNEQEITEPEFEKIFKTHFRALHSYAYTIIREEAHAEEIVQQVFYKVWERKKGLNIMRVRPF